MTDLGQILRDIGYVLSDQGRNYRTRPLYRDSNNDTVLSINKETGDWYDFAANFGGTLEMLIEKTLGQPLTKDLRAKIESQDFLPQRKEEVELPSQKTFDKALLVRLVKNHEYWKKRGISERVTERFCGGVAINGKMMNRYVFPIFNERTELVGFSGRYLYQTTYLPKWKHLGGKSAWIYPLIHANAIMAARRAILVESIGDMLALEEAGISNTLVTFGVKISPQLTSFLLKLNLEKIHIAFNNDQRNNSVGNRAAEDNRVALLSYFDEHQVAKAVPDTKNDFGEMSQEEIMQWKKNLS